MKQAIALRHIAVEDLDALAAPLAAARHAVSYREAPTDDLAAPDLPAADLVVALGGPIGVLQTEDYPFLRTEIALIATVLGTSVAALRADAARHAGALVAAAHRLVASWLAGLDAREARG
jgi:GMP synthase (glutamine-hydrolysing)